MYDVATRDDELAVIVHWMVVAARVLYMSATEAVVINKLNTPPLLGSKSHRRSPK